MPLEEKTVSVIMTVHNAETYLAKAVESILLQTFNHFEFIIIDNGSSDTSLEGLKIYAKKDGRITLVSRAHSNTARALNDGIAQATGRFIAVMHPENVAAPERLGVQVKYLQENTQCVAVGTDMLLIDEDALPLWTLGCEARPADIEDQLLKGNRNAIHHDSIMIRRGPLLQIHGYRNDIEDAEDLDLFIRLLKLGAIHNITRPLSYQHTTFEAEADSTPHDKNEAWLNLINEHRSQSNLATIESLPTPKTNAPQHTHQAWAQHALSIKQCKTAQKYARKHLAASPFNLNAWRLFLACRKAKS